MEDKAKKKKIIKRVIIVVIIIILMYLLASWIFWDKLVSLVESMIPTGPLGPLPETIE